MADLSAITGTVDVWSDGDFLPHMPFVTGRLALAQRLGRRLTTPHGRFKAWPNFGTDIRQFLLSKKPASSIGPAVVAECLKDEQVRACTASATISTDGTAVQLAISITDDEGPFAFTLTISDAAKFLIDLQHAA